MAAPAQSCPHTAFLAKLQGDRLRKKCRTCGHAWTERMPAKPTLRLVK